MSAFDPKRTFEARADKLERTQECPAMAALPISEEQTRKALELLSRLQPPPLALYWEYQDAATSALFVVSVPDQSEAAVVETYFGQVVPHLRNLIPESGETPAWMVIFQDSTGHLITSCSSVEVM
ncbi:hypothetical protein QLQ15_09280 [Lysobacter sp. LF1]|uniref:Uncharacterized protein n=1 Tax=Lysobacter stagni TaxID=3045172 RepID=A0ABT6XG16_9GAMM|nr:hypothetical protein [Lysobacter sp. LF1]MDI9239100.1 hypothetical protein [Lysobacter sp. LF1]